MRFCRPRPFYFAFFRALRETLLLMSSEFFEAINNNKAAFGLSLDDIQTGKLADYYELIQENSEFLHLVAPCTAEEFAVRHILESLTLLEYLPSFTRFADVGTGAGLPSIPCLIMRDDLNAVLIESKLKKIEFLQTVLARFDLGDRVSLINKQFSEVADRDLKFVTCRALDKFTERLPHLLRWSKNSSKILFGGPTLRAALEKLDVDFSESLLPLSDQRFIFVIPKK